MDFLGPYKVYFIMGRLAEYNLRHIITSYCLLLGKAVAQVKPSVVVLLQSGLGLAIS